MVVTFQIFKLHDAWLWSYSTAKVVSSSNIFVDLRHWIPRSINCHTIAMAEKANCDEKKSRICVFNNYDNNGGES